jgi:hypothetical protein
MSSLMRSDRQRRSTSSMGRAPPCSPSASLAAFSAPAELPQIADRVHPGVVVEEAEGACLEAAERAAAADGQAHAVRLQVLSEVVERPGDLGRPERLQIGGGQGRIGTDQAGPGQLPLGVGPGQLQRLPLGLELAFDPFGLGLLAGLFPGELGRSGLDVAELAVVAGPDRLGRRVIGLGLGLGSRGRLGIGHGSRSPPGAVGHPHHADRGAARGGDQASFTSAQSLPAATVRARPRSSEMTRRRACPPRPTSEQGPMSRQEVFELVRDRLADILETEPGGIK